MKPDNLNSNMHFDGYMCINFSFTSTLIVILITDIFSITLGNIFYISF